MLGLQPPRHTSTLPWRPVPEAQAERPLSVQSGDLRLAVRQCASEPGGRLWDAPIPAVRQLTPRTAGSDL